MLITLGYCNKDFYQTLRLMRWIGFLSELDGESMKFERILLVTTRNCFHRRMHSELLSLAQKIFAEVHTFFPTEDYERGWPASCNRMFEQALIHTENHFVDDVLWLEPDVVTLYPAWYGDIRAEFEVAKANGKSFMGDYIGKYKQHMSGIAVYGRNWRALAPKLINVPPNWPWDVWSADQVLPHAHHPPLIQHIPSTPPIYNLAGLRPGAAIFHKDKRGSLFGLLDAKHFGCAASEHPVFSYVEVVQESVMTKYYHTDNASKKVRSGEFEFLFSPYDNFAGAWRGIYETGDETEQVALDFLVHNPASAVTELTQAEYEAKVKKKAPTITSRQSVDWKPPQAKINPNPAAVLVENPSPSPSQADVGLDKPATITNINDVLSTGYVEPQPTEPILGQPRANRRAPRRNAVPPQ